MGASLTIGTRGSDLALWQAEAVRDAILSIPDASMHDLDVDIRVISTKGDRDVVNPLPSLGDKGAFTKELEEALLRGDVDLCVHSMKDVSAVLPDGLRIGAMLERGDVRDALVYGDGRPERITPEDLPEGTTVGTSSVRRAAQLMELFPNIVPCDIRGNVETRVSKALGEGMGGAILAVAGLERLDMGDVISCVLDPTAMVPAPGQGAVGIEVRSDDPVMRQVCDAIDHPATSTSVDAERRISLALGGGCTAPFGAYVRPAGSGWAVDAVALAPDGSCSCRVSTTTDDTGLGGLDDLVDVVIGELVSEGAREVLGTARGDG